MCCRPTVVVSVLAATYASIDAAHVAEAVGLVRRVNAVTHSHISGWCPCVRAWVRFSEAHAHPAPQTWQSIDCDESHTHIHILHTYRAAPSSRSFWRVRRSW